jgi:hypothetical protein
MTTYILINTNNPDDPILGVYDSELLAMKRENYFKTGGYSSYNVKIVVKEMEYIDRD